MLTQSAKTAGTGGRSRDVGCPAKHDPEAIVSPYALDSAAIFDTTPSRTCISFGLGIERSDQRAALKHLERIP